LFRWLDPPDGDSVGAVPQREYNDFDPFKAEHDFWNESSMEGFEDPGQDPMKPNRHKLFGQEYWVAKPMLMEKYDFDEHEIRGQVIENQNKIFNGMMSFRKKSQRSLKIWIEKYRDI